MATEDDIRGGAGRDDHARGADDDGRSRSGEAGSADEDARGAERDSEGPSEEDAGGPGEQRFPGAEPIRLPIEPILDLHSFLPAEVESVVVEYLEEARRAGFEEVRIIHGRGIGVQREIVRAVLSRTPFVISFRDARPESGGWGATVALLSRQ